MNRSSDLEEKLHETLRRMPGAERLASNYWLSQIWKTAIFSSEYAAAAEIEKLIVPTAFGASLINDVCRTSGVLEPDAKLALYGMFCWHEVLVDVEKCELNQLQAFLAADLLADRIRLPYIWGRILHDIYTADSTLVKHEPLPHEVGWRLLTGTPIGVFQHGRFVTGPIGLLESSEHRWLPVFPVVNAHILRGTKRFLKPVGFAPADIGVVIAYRAFERELSGKGPNTLPWDPALSWYSSQQLIDPKTDYADIVPIIADCIIGDERTALLESVLTSVRGSVLRAALRTSARGKSLAGLPPRDLSSKCSQFEQLQLLLCADTKTLAACIDELVLSRNIKIPASEVRVAKRVAPTKGISFPTELSSFGIRPAHPEPIAALCSSLLRAYAASDSVDDLRWRLGCDASRVVPAALTEYLRNHGPAEAVPQLILSSRAVTEIVCSELGLSINEVLPRTDRTVPRILWKFGFEIPRHDDVLERFHRRLSSFEELVTGSDLTRGESVRERIRSEGVNLFVSVEAFLDRLLSYNVWLVSSDHWGVTRFEFRLSQARARVASMLGESLETGDGRVSWKANGENALGTQLAYLTAFERWLATLPDPSTCERPDLDHVSVTDEFNREFPFRHTQLWADSDRSELLRYKELLKTVVKAINQSQVCNVRNGIDHHREGSRFPSDDELVLCIARLRTAVTSAERDRLFPVEYWFDSKFEKLFGSTEYCFRSRSGKLLSTYRPATVSALPGFTRIQPVLFSPVNFLAAADGLLHFKVMGESVFSEYWNGYPRISKQIMETNDQMAQLECSRDGETSVEMDQVSSGNSL